MKYSPAAGQLLELLNVLLQPVNEVSRDAQEACFETLLTGVAAFSCARVGQEKTIEFLRTTIEAIPPGCAEVDAELAQERSKWHH